MLHLPVRVALSVSSYGAHRGGISFFLYCSGDHRDLHSFPTRRSSDLDFVEAVGQLFIDAAQFAPARRRVRSHELIRSEEHTSELQSPVHLVCRLLLEKKKARLTTPPKVTDTVTSDVLREWNASMDEWR